MSRADRVDAVVGVLMALAGVVLIGWRLLTGRKVLEP